MTSAVTNSTHFSGEKQPDVQQGKLPKYSSKYSGRYDWTQVSTKAGMFIGYYEPRLRNTPLLDLTHERILLSRLGSVNQNRYRDTTPINLDAHVMTEPDMAGKPIDRDDNVTKLENVLKLTRLIAEYADVQIGANRLIVECLDEQYGLIRV